MLIHKSSKKSCTLDPITARHLTPSPGPGDLVHQNSPLPSATQAAEGSLNTLSGIVHTVNKETTPCIKWLLTGG